MDISIVITPSEILESVGMHSAYVGDRFVGDETAYGRISTTQSEEAMLTEALLDGRNVLIKTLEPFISSMVLEGSVWGIECSFPSRASSHALACIGDDANSYLRSFVLSKWYMVTNKQEAQAEALVAQGFLESIRTAIYTRTKPTRK